MKTLPPRSPDPHEKLLIEIRSQPKLRPIKEGKVLGKWYTFALHSFYKIC